MGLEFHVWPPEWIEALCIHVDMAVARTQGRIERGDMDELVAAASQLAGGDRGQGEQLLSHVIGEPRFRAVFVAVQARGEQADVADAEPDSRAQPVLDLAHELARLATSPAAVVRAGVAGHPSTPVAVLRALAEDSDYYVRTTVAENMNTPMETVAQLGFPTELDTWVRVSAERHAQMGWQLSSRGDEVFLRMAERGATKAELAAFKSFGPHPISLTPVSPVALARLARHASVEVRKAVARHANTPAEAMRTLARDDQRDVRSQVAKRPDTPPEVLQGLAGDGYFRIMEGVARNPRTPPGTLRALATDPTALLSRRDRRHWDDRNVGSRGSLQLIEAACSNPAMPVDVLVGLMPTASLEVRLAIAANHSAPPGVLEALGEDDSYSPRPFLNRVSARVAGNPSTPIGTLEALSRHRETDVLQVLAGNPSTPIAVLEALSRHCENGMLEVVLEVVAGNPRTPVEVLRRLAEVATDRSPGGWSAVNTFPLRMRLAANHRTPLESLELLIGSRSMRVIALALSNSAATADFLRTVADPPPATNRGW